MRLSVQLGTLAADGYNMLGLAANGCNVQITSFTSGYVRLKNLLLVAMGIVACKAWLMGPNFKERQSTIERTLS